MNTAGRLLSIYDRLLGHGLGQDVHMVQVWAKVFGLPTDDRHLEDSVVVCLQATRSELELMRARLAALGAPEDLTQTAATRLRNYTSTTQLHAYWKSVQEDARRPENRLAFAWASWALRDEAEDDLSDDEFAALQAELDALAASLQEVEMTVYLKGFIQRQIDAIRSALRVYRVQGVKPVEEALRNIVGTYAVEKSRLEAEHAKASEPARGLVERMGAFVEKTAKAADNLDKIRKAGEGAFTLAASVGPAIAAWLK